MCLRKVSAIQSSSFLMKLNCFQECENAGLENLNLLKYFWTALRRYKGFRLWVRGHYSCAEQAKKVLDFKSNFSVISCVTFHKPHTACPGKPQSDFISTGFSGGENQLLISLWISFLISKWPTSELNASSALQYPWRGREIGMLTVLAASSQGAENPD